MINFIHTADIHFGVENYGKIDAKTGIHTRLLDFENALNFCIDYTIAQKADFFIFTGDAYKTANPSPTQQKLLMRCLLRLYAHKIPVIIIVGNHDHPLSFGKANSLDIFGNLPIDGFHVVSKPQIINLTTKNGPVQIVGIPWPTRNTVTISDQQLFKSASEITDYIANLVSQLITHFASQLDPHIPAILGGHLTVSSGIFSGSEKRAIYGTDPVLLPSQLAIKPFDYIALGHLHRYQDLNAGSHPAIVYAGSIERVDFGERKEEKGFCHVTITNKQTTTHQFIPTPTRPFIQIDITLKPINQIDIGSSHHNHQTWQVLNALKQHHLKDAVLKIKYELPENETDIVNLKTIQLACSDAMFIVSIIGTCKPQARVMRTSMKNSTDLPTMLKHYFTNKPELKERSENLTNLALQLAQDLQEKEHEED
jgi:exonuclease SbcD